MPRGSTSKKLSNASKSKGYAELDDGVLDDDSEEDEFASYGRSSGGKSSGGQGKQAAYSDDDGEDDEEEMYSGSDADNMMYDDDSDEGDGVGVYEPDEWDGGDSASDSEDDDDDEAAGMKKLQKGLGSIPLDTLVKAQRSMKKASKKSAAQASYSDDDDGPTGNSREDRVAAMKARLASMQRAKGKALGVPDEDDEGGPSGRRRRDDDGHEDEEGRRERQKRDHKHAPTVMSTKRQVGRHRQVVDVPRVDRRDPRFSSLSGGPVDAHIHARGYAFMPEMLRSEMSNLRAAVAAAGKAEKACKLVDKPRYTAEREHLEKELARVRTRLERGEREGREREVLAEAKRAEREKRESGKGVWYMKKSEKKDLLLKARFAALEERGGKHAVKKAVDKKLKKIAGKEKKSRPFQAGGGGGGGGGEHKRRRV